MCEWRGECSHGLGSSYHSNGSVTGVTGGTLYWQIGGKSALWSNWRSKVMINKDWNAPKDMSVETISRPVAPPTHCLDCL